MSVRADWGTTADASAPAPEIDPFASAESLGVMEPLTPVDLTNTEDELREQFASLFERERNLFNCGVECPLKEMPDSTCTACPVSRARDTNDPYMGQLCRVGVEQERVQMLLLAKRQQSGV